MVCRVMGLILGLLMRWCHLGNRETRPAFPTGVICSWEVGERELWASGEQGPQGLVLTVGEVYLRKSTALTLEGSMTGAPETQVSYSIPGTAFIVRHFRQRKKAAGGVHCVTDVLGRNSCQAPPAGSGPSVHKGLGIPERASPKGGPQGSRPFPGGWGGQGEGGQ